MLCFDAIVSAIVEHVLLFLARIFFAQPYEDRGEDTPRALVSDAVLHHKARGLASYPILRPPPDRVGPLPARDLKQKNYQ